jgi:adenylate cyclase class 2
VSSHTASQNLEVEVKFLVANLPSIRDRLLALSATLDKPRTYERNVRYDNAWQGLQQEGKLLRLRQDAAVRLTFKGNPAEEVNSEARVREELEIDVSDFGTAAAILERIGFEGVQVYEKYRETFKLGPVEVVLDEMPFGDFVELEGEESAIRNACKQLGLEWNERILENYLTLLARLKAHWDLPFDDLTFDNFADLNVSVADLFPGRADLP